MTNPTPPGVPARPGPPAKAADTTRENPWPVRALAQRMSEYVAKAPAAWVEGQLAQVRGHLRDLTPDDVSALLRWEQDGDSRPPFLTLLSNRLVTLDAQNQ